MGTQSARRTKTRNTITKTCNVDPCLDAVPSWRAEEIIMVDEPLQCDDTPLSVGALDMLAVGTNYVVTCPEGCRGGSSVFQQPPLCGHPVQPTDIPICAVALSRNIAAGNKIKLLISGPRNSFEGCADFSRAE